MDPQTNVWPGFRIIGPVTAVLSESGWESLQSAMVMAYFLSLLRGRPPTLLFLAIVLSASKAPGDTLMDLKPPPSAG
jgi:hypothetical protein